MTLENVLSVLGVLGIGSLISSYVALLLQRRNADRIKHQEYKETRYKCIIMLMHTYMNFDQNKAMLKKYDYDIQNRSDLTDLLKAELINSFLFATDDFIHSFEQFIETPSQPNLRRVALAIRKDLWGVKTKIQDA